MVDSAPASALADAPGGGAERLGSSALDSEAGTGPGTPPAVISFAVNLNPGDDRRGDDASDALNGDPSLVPADHGEIKSWYLYDCASSPVAATVVTFWALLVTGYAKSRAASTRDVVEWREHYAGGPVCVGECVSSDADGATLESVACGAYDASVYGTTRKFERPEGVGGTCQWFPVDPSLPGSGLDFGAVLVYCNFVTQLACGAFLVFFGSLGDFSSFRKRGLVMGWLAFSIAPLVAGFVSPGNEDDPANANATQQTLVLAAALYVVTNIAHLSAQQMYDAYLPLLAQTHPRVLKMMREATRNEEEGTGREKNADATDSAGKQTNGVFARMVSKLSSVPIHDYHHPSKVIEVVAHGNVEPGADATSLSLATRVAFARQSAASEMALRAPTMGFLSIVLITLAQLGAVLAAGEENRLKGIRWTLLVVGAWSGSVGFLGLRGIKTRPGPPVFGEGSLYTSTRTSVFAALARLGTRRTILSVRMLREFHPQLLKLLCGQILSAITNGTMLSTYTIFVQRELGAGATDLVILVFTASVLALISTAAFSVVAPRLDANQLKWTLFCLKAATVTWPVWMFFGFRRKIEMWLLPVVAAPFNSNILPTLRSVFQQATPRGYEAALFSLVGVCTVAFTWIGSLIVGGLLAATGSMRWGLLAVSAFVLSSLPLFYSFDPEKARVDRRRIERGEMEALDGGSRFAELRSENVAIG
jgi:UMF1 family MFS transporter